MRSACGEGLRLRVSEEAPGDEVVVSDTLEREGDVDRSSNEESELRDIIGWGWYKREKGLRTGGGALDQDGEGGGEQGGRKKCWMSGEGGGLGCGGGERAETGWSQKRGGEPGLFVALLRGGVGLWSLWTRGRGERNGRLCCAVGALRGGVGCCLPWAFTGMVGAGCGFGAGLVESFGRGGCRLQPCFWFRFWFRLGLHGRW